MPSRREFHSAPTETADPKADHARDFLARLSNDAHRQALAAQMVPPNAVVPATLGWQLKREDARRGKQR